MQWNPDSAINRDVGSGKRSVLNIRTSSGLEGSGAEGATIFRLLQYAQGATGPLGPDTSGAPHFPAHCSSMSRPLTPLLRDLYG